MTRITVAAISLGGKRTIRPGDIPSGQSLPIMRATWPFPPMRVNGYRPIGELHDHPARVDLPIRRGYRLSGEDVLKVVAPT